MKFVFSFCLMLLFLPFVLAQKPKQIADAAERARGSSGVLRDYVSLGKDTVPYEQLQKAKAIAVFGGLDRTSILLSEILLGNGMAAVRRDSGWSVPAFVVFKGTDFNFRIAGKKSFDAVFLFMSDHSVDWLKQGDVHFTKKVAKVAPGPVVKNTTADGADVLYYTFEKGQLTDAQLRNNVVLGAFSIFHDNNFNKAIFGMRTNAIFEADREKVKMSEEVESVLKLLRDSSPAGASANGSEK